MGPRNMARQVGLRGMDPGKPTESWRPEEGGKQGLELTSLEGQRRADVIGRPEKITKTKGPREQKGLGSK